MYRTVEAHVTCIEKSSRVANRSTNEAMIPLAFLRKLREVGDLPFARPDCSDIRPVRPGRNIGPKC
jgi:hypothetical protein